MGVRALYFRDIVFKSELLPSSSCLFLSFSYSSILILLLPLYIISQSSFLLPPFYLFHLFHIPPLLLLHFPPFPFLFLPFIFFLMLHNILYVLGHFHTCSLVHLVWTKRTNKMRCCILVLVSSVFTLTCCSTNKPWE